MFSSRKYGVVQIEAESLSRKNELDEISQRVEDKKLVLGNVLMQAKVVEEHVKTKQESLRGEISSLLVSGKSLTISRKRLQETSRLFAGERGYTRLNTLEKMLRARQQHMISHVSFIYPVKTLIGATQELELDSFPNCSTSGTSGGSVDEYRKKNRGNLTISGVQLSMIPFSQMTLFTDKNQMQKSTTALGYVAHAITLIASYLHVPLRYPVRLGGSHSYVKDRAPLFEPSSSGSSSNVVDIEQLLNYVGVESQGPRHVLANLKELFRTILSPEFVEKGKL
ncbi:hypothetical protein KSS87_016411 [Heliosperma pusillum]|nr:hypothetical protein KSS87_016411 [Heliosperma pusillum]